MYAGAGAGPLMAAAAAWNNLAAELSTTAAQYESIITSLTTEQWTGAGSAAAAAAAQPYVDWLTSTSAAAEQAGAQATASAAAYEAAFTGDGAPAGNRGQPGASWPRWSRPTSWASTRPRSWPPRPSTSRCGSKTPSR